MKTNSFFCDRRLDKEYDRLVTNIAASGSAVINRACLKKSEKKAAYRFLNNENVTVERIEQDLVNQMADNVVEQKVKVLMISQDTMETVRENIRTRLAKNGREVLQCAKTNAGMRTHSALVLDADTGVPVGFGYLKIWGRQPKPKAEVKEDDFSRDRRRQASYYIKDPDTGKTMYKYNIPITARDSESARWIDSVKRIRKKVPPYIRLISLQDREGDMFPLLTLPSELENVDIIVRASKKRSVMLPDGKTQDIFSYTASTEIKGTYTITVPKRPRRKARQATLNLRYGEIRIRRPHTPVYPQKYVDLYFVRVTEDSKPAGNAEPVDWLLITSIPTFSPEEAMKIVEYYRRRWFIEDFHRLLKKKGFGIEDIQLESPHAFGINLALCIKAAYEVALVKKGFDSEDDTIPASIAFTPLELQIVSNLNNYYNSPKKIYRNPYEKGSLAWAAWAVACEGGWSAIPSQPRPGVITFKRGIDRIETIYEYALQVQDNLFVGKG